MGVVSKMLYRVRQFAKALIPKVNAEEISWVKQKLSPPAQRLFFKQDRGEQRHALDVAKRLFQDLNSLHPGQTQETYALASAKNHARALLSPAEAVDLLTAAILHDCGKSLVQVKIWHRVVIVFVQNLPSPWQYRLKHSRSLLTLPLRISSRHARWGELLARQAGLNSNVCRLIAEHHQPTTKLGLMLKQADDLS